MRPAQVGQVCRVANLKTICFMESDTTIIDTDRSCDIDYE